VHELRARWSCEAENGYFVDWLKDRIFLEGIKRDDRYAQTRLGFQAANIFVMSLTNY